MLLCSVPLTGLVVVLVQDVLESFTFLMELLCLYKAMLEALTTEIEVLNLSVSTAD